ncbi:MAG: galactokinase [Erysipelotrichaceae bacterium]|nr:galactokinase [Erysipelotrichaceae bacterium]
MNYIELKEYINSDRIDAILSKIICSNELNEEKARYTKLLEEAVQLYGDGDFHIISSPGRSEIGGNHTDHQHGHVIAASLNIDNIAIFKPNNENIVRYKDGSFETKAVDLSDLKVHENELNTSESLIRGVAYRISELGYKYGGFDMVCNSKVLVGSGISSSACFEVMIVEAFNGLYNNDKIEAAERAKIGQYAENFYFGKPSGLLDQTAISVGGFVAIDFRDPDKPLIENYEFSFADHGYDLILVNTKGDHSDLSHEYAAVTVEIKEVAKQLGVNFLADSTKQELFNNLAKIRETIKNDRAVLRAIHFFNEDERAIKEKEAIRNNDIASLLKLMVESGRSSFEYLQNVYPASRVDSQSLSIGLALADTYLGDKGAYRVHGGGFEGTIQAVVPKNMTEGFRNVMKSVFGEDCLLEVKVRPFGTKMIV